MSVIDLPELERISGQLCISYNPDLQASAPEDVWGRAAFHMSDLGGADCETIETVMLAERERSGTAGARRGVPDFLVTGARIRTDRRKYREAWT
jgi:hypothetical protein